MSVLSQKPVLFERRRWFLFQAEEMNCKFEIRKVFNQFSFSFYFQYRLDVMIKKKKELQRMMH